MRLFLIDQTPLAALSSYKTAPAAGDVVLFTRDAVDPLGDVADELRSRSVDVRWAESLLSPDDDNAIDGFVDRFSEHWYPGQRDPSRLDSIFSQIVFNEAIAVFYVNFIVRDGEILSRMFARWPDATELITDIADGVAQFVDVSETKDAMPRARLVCEFAERAGISVKFVAPGETGIPSSWLQMPRSLSLWAFAKSWVGGLRKDWRRGRRHASKTKGATKPHIYLFFAQGFDALAEALTGRDAEISGDRIGINGVRPIRYDHEFAVPGFSVWRAAWRVSRAVHRQQRHGFPDTDLVCFRGFNYGPYFADALSATAPGSLLFSVLKFGQVRAFYARHRFDLVVINGEGNPAMRAFIHYAPAYESRVAFVDHSYYMHPFGYFPQGRNHRNVVYVAQGTDYVATYGKHLSEGEKPWRPAVTNPCISIMEKTRRARQPQTGRRRAMLTNYAPAPVFSVNRGRYCDRYMIDLLTAAKQLMMQGWQVIYRPHPGIGNDAYEHYMIDKMGLTGKIEISRTRLFSDAIVSADVVVTNCSGACYQSLYAGWPTIFYEPDFRPACFVGLPAALDISPPVASTPEELTRLVSDAVERPDSPVAVFPSLFCTTYAERFIGKHPERCGETLAEFLFTLAAGLQIERPVTVGETSRTTIGAA